MSVPAVWKKCVFAALVTAGIWGALTAPALLAQKPEAKPGEKPAVTEKKKSVRRLPAHYADLVDGPQREKIYSLQEKYDAQISPLAEQIKALQTQRDAEIEAVLNAEQKVKLAAARADAKAKAAARRAALAKPAEKPAATTNSTTTQKSASAPAATTPKPAGGGK